METFLFHYHLRSPKDTYMNALLFFIFVTAAIPPQSLPINHLLDRSSSTFLPHSFFHIWTLYYSYYRRHSSSSFILRTTTKKFVEQKTNKKTNDAAQQKGARTKKEKATQNMQLEQQRKQQP